MMRIVVAGVLAIGVCVAVAGSLRAASSVPGDPGARLARREHVGEALFMDESLSEPRGTSCASCHEPARAFSGNHGSTRGIARGSRPEAFGLRNTPTLTYASFGAFFAVDHEGDEGAPAPGGGFFLDGRADTLAEQARGPLLAPLEMNNPDAAAVVAKVEAGAYAAEFRAAWGQDIFSDTARAFAAVCASLQAFEGTAPFHPFSSRYDEALRGRLALTAAEERGKALFFDVRRGNCVTCHAARPWCPDPTASLFTSGVYENLGVPRNRAIPANADPAFFDLGLGGPERDLPFRDRSFNGMFKAGTLRNIAVKQAFMHNGVFTRLEDVVAFYATRDTAPERWYAGGAAFDDLPTALKDCVNTVEVPGDLHRGDRPHLDERDIADLVAFLRALTDREFTGALPPAATARAGAADVVIQH